MKFIIKTSVNDKFYFVLQSRNGKLIITSQMYHDKQACKKGISSLRRSMFAKIVDATL